MRLHIRSAGKTSKRKSWQADFGANLDPKMDIRTQEAGSTDPGILHGLDSNATGQPNDHVIDWVDIIIDRLLFFF